MLPRGGRRAPDRSLAGLACPTRTMLFSTFSTSTECRSVRHGSRIDPPNRFERAHVEADLDQVDADAVTAGDQPKRRIEYLEDDSRSIVTENNSPDIPFRYSLNPYRGCIHACAYCYARPSHEYLGFNAGLDFETRIVVKQNAPQLFREFLARPNWRVEPITFSGITDCYQPAERQFQLTRRCLEVALECRQPVSVITKNALVLRDLDLLQPLADQNLVHVFVSITTLSPELARDMEPRTSTPEARLRIVETLSGAGVPVGVMVAPTIPGLNDSEIPAILESAHKAGAGTAGYVLLRLPLTVEPVFIEWLERTQPLAAERVLGRLREARGGKVNESGWGQRMTGSGALADNVRTLFRLFRRKYGLDQPLPAFNCDAFQPPAPVSGQLRLF